MKRAWLFLLGPVIVGIILAILIFGTFVYHFKPIPWPIGVAACLFVIVVGLMFARLKYHKPWLSLGGTLIVIFTECIIFSFTNVPVSLPYFITSSKFPLIIGLVMVSLLLMKRIRR